MDSTSRRRAHEPTVSQAPLGINVGWSTVRPPDSKQKSVKLMKRLR
jgi:hypothetical protein